MGKRERPAHPPLLEDLREGAPSRARARDRELERGELLDVDVLVAAAIVSSMPGGCASGKNEKVPVVEILAVDDLSLIAAIRAQPFNVRRCIRKAIPTSSADWIGLPDEGNPFN